MTFKDNITGFNFVLRLIRTLISLLYKVFYIVYKTRETHKIVNTELQLKS